MSIIVIQTVWVLAVSAAATLLSFRMAVHWTKKMWSAAAHKKHDFGTYWQAKNAVRSWEKAYVWSFRCLVVGLLFSVGLGAFSVAF